MAKKYCRKFQPPAVRRTNVTDDRQICDSKDPNVTSEPTVAINRNVNRNSPVCTQQTGRPILCAQAYVGVYIYFTRAKPVVINDINTLTDSEQER